MRGDEGKGDSLVLWVPFQESSRRLQAPGREHRARVTPARVPSQLGRSLASPPPMSRLSTLIGSLRMSTGLGGGPAVYSRHSVSAGCPHPHLSGEGEPPKDSGWRRRQQVETREDRALALS